MDISSCTKGEHPITKEWVSHWISELTDFTPKQVEAAVEHLNLQPRQRSA